MDIAQFSTDQKLCGPVTAKRLIRLCALYLLVAGFGVLLVLFSEAVSWQIAGLGLIFPAAGFLAHADLSSLSGLVHIAMTLAGVGMFLLSLVVWFATGNVLAPPLTWVVLAVMASAMPHGHLHSTSLWGAVGLAVATGMAMVGVAFWAMLTGQKKRRDANQWLQGEGAALAATFSKPTTTCGEFSEADVKQMRFLLDRALQPLEAFDGFEWRDQFQTAAIRYQLNFIGYALSMAQATHLPAFQGYLTEAQRRLIVKQTDYRVWRYWTLENLWGNLRYNPDPIHRENIMFTGFCATQMALFEAASGQGDFKQPDSFTVQHPNGQRYASCASDLIASMQRETARSAFHLIACEPNWIYPLCNTIGAAAVKSYAPDVWEGQHAHFRQMLDQEFLAYGTSIVPCRSQYTGLSLPRIGGVMPQAMPCFFLNAILPDVAMRQWLSLRRQVLSATGLRHSNFWRIDTGNYRPSRAAAYAATALAAAELGDDEVRDLCLSALDAAYPSVSKGQNFYRPKASIWAHAVEFMARATTPHAFKRLMSAAPQPQKGLFICAASYPEVLVARAVCENGMLSAVFYPGDAPSRQAIEIAGLIAGQVYVCDGADEKNIVGNAAGNALIHLHLDGRKEILIKPLA